MDSFLLIPTQKQFYKKLKRFPDGDGVASYKHKIIKPKLPQQNKTKKNLKKTI
jgi:hypothetical protein